MWFDSVGERDQIWLYGKPGVGKSLLAAYLVEQALVHASPDAVVAYFFCDGTAEPKPTSGTIIRALITQLLKAPDRLLYPDLLKDIMDHVLDKGPSYQFTVGELGQHLSSILKSFTKSW
jgi:Cdc6-like AAA superfamily ATPase